MDSKKLTIVIVSFKSEAKIINCLNSISDPVNIIVVENSNNYNFKKNLEEKFTNLKCILTGSNLGYAVANNIGLNQVKTKYALILNPDTLLNDHAIKNFLNRAEKQKDFWLMGPGNDQMVELEFNNNSLIEVNNLKGFAIFLNLAKFNNTFFDENFFLYFEEIDLCKRVKNTNGKIYLDRNIKIIHQGASSVQDDKKFELEKNRNWHWMWSTFYYNKKHKGFFLALINILPKFFSASIKTLIYSLLFNKNKRDIYYCRLSGIVNSIIGNKSWYRPSLD
jgi:N-acetylglucosaminyl-diphospho-decaprenol L-rhamnosyltransferase